MTVAILGRVRARTATCFAAATAAAGAVAVAGDAGGGGQAQGAEARAAAVRLARVGSFDSPTYVAAPPGDRRRLFVVEREGRIRVRRDGRTLRRSFLDIRSRVQTGGESGLLSMAFAPDYARSRRFYVYFVDNAGFIRIEEFRRARSTGDRTSAGSRRLVLRQRHFRANHKGGQLQFGPDRMLYTAFGDGGGGGDPDRNAQNRGTLLGKMLRIDPRRGRRYRVPRSNPFAGRRGIRGEIYALGLRNPYRFSFDRRKGHLTLADVGQDEVEEVNFVPNRHGRGRAPRGGYNFGWSVFEGRRRYREGTIRRHVRPVIQRSHSEGWCSVIGGYVIRDRSFGRLQGRYVYGDLCNSRLRIAALRSGRARADRRLGPRVEGLVSFGEDARGRVYAVSIRGGVYRLVRR